MFSHVGAKTTTQTAWVASAVPLVLRLRSPQATALEIVASMLGAPRFSDRKTALEVLRDAIVESEPLTNAEAREHFSLLLCHLLVAVLHPEDDVELQKEIEALLSSTLPEGESLSLFVESYRGGIEAKRLSGRMDACRSSLLATANQVNDGLRESFKTVKDRLSAVNEENRKGFCSKQQRLQGVGHRASAARDVLLQIANKAAEL